MSQDADAQRTGSLAHYRKENTTTIAKVVKVIELMS